MFVEIRRCSYEYEDEHDQAFFRVLLRSNLNFEAMGFRKVETLLLCATHLRELEVLLARSKYWWRLFVTMDDGRYQNESDNKLYIPI